MSDPAERFTDLAGKLGNVLFDLKQHPSPYVPNPPGTKKRASVALVVRVNPDFNHGAVSTESAPPAQQLNLDAFFAKDWVKHGSPEVLFIKRIDRSGDRWSGHVALPGGRRDPEDESDLATAIRETQEEVGLDLTSSWCIPVGNLPERIISTTWGNQVLMVICPYVFLWTAPTSPPLRLQPTEIASTHWVPLAGLLSPSLRTQQLTHFSDRLMNNHGSLTRYLIRLMIGKMTFSAIRLIPSESVFSTTLADITSPPPSVNRFRALASYISPTRNLPPKPQPLHLWGLTLGILADFLAQFPPHDAIDLWTYPTFTPYDLQLIIYILTWSKRKQNARVLNDGSRTPPPPRPASSSQQPSPRRYSTGEANNTAIDATTAAVVAIEDEHPENKPITTTTTTAAAATPSIATPTLPKSDAVSTLLNGYYDRLKLAIGAFLVWRLGLSLSVAVALVRWWRRGSRWRK